jgi:hypothetical protein
MGPDMIKVTVGNDILAFLQRLLELGALQGTSTTIQVNPILRSLVDALYQVLAGGDAQVAVLSKGDQGIFEELQRLERQCASAMNEIVTNKAEPVDIM